MDTADRKGVSNMNIQIQTRLLVGAVVLMAISAAASIWATTTYHAYQAAIEEKTMLLTKTETLERQLIEANRVIENSKN